MLGAEASNEGGLADAGLAADEHQTATRSTEDRGELFGEHRQLARTFEQLAQPRRIR